MQVPTVSDLIELIEAFLKRHDWKRTRFGREATGEPQLLDSLISGRSPNLGTVHRIVDFINSKDAELDHDAGAATNGGKASCGRSAQISERSAA